MRYLLNALLACCGTLWGSSVFAADWSSRVFPRGPDREVIALRSAHGLVYAGGAFGSFGPFVRPGLMRWDGQAWSPVGSGLDGTIRGIAVDGRGNIYVSGTFTGPGGEYGLAVWDHAEWSFPPEGRGLAGWGPIAAVGDAVFLVFESKASEIYRLAGSSLSPLEAEADGFIYALEAFGEELIAGGEFTRIGGVSANRVARFGTSWGKMGVGTPMTVRCLAVVDGVLLAGGGIGPAGTSGIPAIARWDGRQWSDFESAPSDRGYISVVAGDAGKILAGGFLYPDEDNASLDVAGLAEWDGISWNRIDDHALYNEVSTLAVAGGEVWAGGRFFNPAAPYLARRRGNAWFEAFPIPSHSLSGPISLLNGRGGRLIAAGAFKGPSPDSLFLLKEWSGDGWEARGPAFPLKAHSASFSAAEPHGDALYVSAMFAGSGLPGLWRISGKDGKDWVPMVGVQGVKALRSTPEGLYAGGNFTQVGTVEARHIARWDGAAWHAVGSGLDYPVTALEWDGSSLFAAQENRRSLSGIPSQVSRFHGGQWTVVGTTASAPLFNGTIHTLAAKGSDIWAAGEFQGNGLLNAKGVAVWNGSAWHGAGDGLAGVSSLAISPAGEVFAAGKFQEPSPGVARWNGSAWEALGKGFAGSDAFNPPVGKAAAWFGEDLFVAGSFDFAGGRPSAGLAIWTSRPEELGILRRAGSASGGKSSRRLFADGRLIFLDPSRTGAGVDALGRGGTDRLPLRVRP